jgi:hypothetical protein
VGHDYLAKSSLPNPAGLRGNAWAVLGLNGRLLHPVALTVIDVAASNQAGLGMIAPGSSAAKRWSTKRELKITA